MQPSVDDVADDFDSLSINSTTTTTTSTTTATSTATSTATETQQSMSSGSETTPRTVSSLVSSSAKPHAPSHDPCWDVIRRIKSENSMLTLEDLRFVRRLGSGDIGSVYLVGLKGSKGCMFAAKVMDKKELVTRNKDSRARIEKEILETLDHPFLPTLYATLETPRWSCLLTEFCPGGDLHVLRQNQLDKRFDEAAVRFYASEVVVALEYLHMMGIVYRDLKPENVLVRTDGHIMLTDFDLSLKGDGTTSMAQLVSDENPPTAADPSNEYPNDAPPFANSSCIMPNCIAPAVSCFHPKHKRKKRSDLRGALQIVAEPIDVRSMSFVGTHEYLAPEIVSGEGHGNAVDWWTLGVFIFELFYGVTPFKGVSHELTLTNIVARALQFPKEPTVPAPAKDLMLQLLIKDPTQTDNMNIFSKKPNPKEAFRESKREMANATRGIEKEIGALQLEEKKLVAEIKRTAKTGNEAATKILARQLVRLRQQIANLQGSRAQMRGIATHTQAMHAQSSVAVGMKGATKAMAAMNKQMAPAKQAKVMLEFQRQSAQMDMTTEMMSDAIDDALDDDEAEEESEDLTNQVLDEIGVDVASQLSAAPKGRIAQKNAEGAGSSGIDELEKRLAALRNP